MFKEMLCPCFGISVIKTNISGVFFKKFAYKNNQILEPWTLYSIKLVLHVCVHVHVQPPPNLSHGHCCLYSGWHGVNPRTHPSVVESLVLLPDGVLSMNLRTLHVTFLYRLWHWKPIVASIHSIYIWEFMLRGYELVVRCPACWSTTGYNLW